MSARSKIQDTALERSEWLSLARQQSERRVQQQLSIERRFDWSRVDRPRRMRFAWGPLRVLALAALLLALVGTGTWAFVQSRRQEAITLEPLGELLRHRVAQVGPAPVVRRTRRKPLRHTITERQVTPKRGRVSARVVVAKKTARAGSGAEPSLPHRTGPRAGPMTFGDEVIVVVPKAKMKPLFSVQDYRRKHR